MHVAGRGIPADLIDALLPAGSGCGLRTLAGAIARVRPCQQKLMSAHQRARGLAPRILSLGWVGEQVDPHEHG